MTYLWWIGCCGMCVSVFLLGVFCLLFVFCDAHSSINYLQKKRHSLLRGVCRGWLELVGYVIFSWIGFTAFFHFRQQFQGLFLLFSRIMAQQVSSRG
uniref:Uncharacterized protein n=1 Tax=Anguilla anguilla TaxID=7936 RepID=A0A0E9X4M3_ANGAN